MAIMTLDIDETDLIDFQLYGIASSYADPAHFVYHLNLNFETRFVRSEDLDLIVNKRKAYYPVFEWDDSETGILYQLIKNAPYTYGNSQDEGDLSTLFDISPILIRSMKDYNFLLKETGFSDEKFPFKENHFIQLVTAVDVQSLKQADRLIF